ncbi:acryloyl-CoA reductase electron transfer subunit gamma [Peptostreptococcus anaerobius]|uniref:acryloyl-CoA reductase electron transfer subunit gamma n=1 Tax=Peptostreptococcus anaerobius TaxID=1261 RepID=UPI0025502CF7|nr:acryloyl-CoA reductase electron transfer subunit gamma [Peptostreptococcus anaerobius]MDK8277541.1 electron transfer flavoprotein subunit beta/FixA family protein [Peptostreptococcus anaerobius]
MRIFVCVKQVPDTSGKVAVNPDGTLNRNSMAAIINPDDMIALEQALRLRDELNCQLTALTMGPPQAEGMLREILAIGADDAVLISSREFGGSDTYATSQIIAAAISHLGLNEEDIIFCGRQAIDGDTAQVGPQIAEKLEVPQVTYASKIKKYGNKLTIKRMLEDGYMMIETKTPCLITCVKDDDISPRYMTINGIMDCYSKPMTVLSFQELKDEPLINLETIGLKGSPTNIFKSFTPPQKGTGIMLEGDGKETVAELTNRLEKLHLI